MTQPKMTPEYRGPRPGEVAMYLSTHAEWLANYGDEIRFRPSPCCGDNDKRNPSCQVHSQTGLWRCFKASCNATGNFFTLTRAFGDPIPYADRFKNRDLGIDLNTLAKFANPISPRRPVTGGHHPELLDYCHERGLTDDTLNAFKVSTKGPGNLRWPMFAAISDKWQMVNARIRACLNKSPDQTVSDWFEVRGGPTGLLIGNHLMDPTGPKRAVIFEGQWDVMTAYQLGMRNVFSLPNGAGNVAVGTMLRYIPEDWEIWLGMDMDEAGGKACELFFAQVDAERLVRLNLPVKDLNDWLMEKPGLTQDEVIATGQGLAIANPVAEVGFMSLDMDSEDSDDPNEIVCTTPWERLSELLNGGLYGGQTTGLLAPSGIGKTTVVNHMAVHAALTIVAGVISLEGTRVALKRKIKHAIKASIKQEHWATVAKNLIVSKIEGKKAGWESCIQEFHTMAQAGARLLIWDNLDFMTQGDSNEKIRAYAEFIELCKQYNVHGIAVWQPNKVDRAKVVNSGNQKGYSQALQDADNYLNLNRVQDFRFLEVEKVREKGVSEGSKVWLIYDDELKTLTQCAEPPEEKPKAALVGLPGLH